MKPKYIPQVLYVVFYIPFFRSKFYHWSFYTVELQNYWIKQNLPIYIQKMFLEKPYLYRFYSLGWHNLIIHP